MANTNRDTLDKYTYSKSLNGDKIVYIARNSFGAVVFRAESQSKLQASIIDAVEEKKAREEADLMAKAKKEVVEEIKHPKKAIENKLREELAKRAEQKLKEQVLARKAALSQTTEAK